MYIPKEFEEKRSALIDQLIVDCPFVGLFINGNDGWPLGVHLPIVSSKTNGTWVFEAHVALANPIAAQLLKSDLNVLCVFQGPDGYVSSSLYEHDNVPTWNYQVLHAKCLASKLSDEALEKHLSELVDLHEKDRSDALKYDQLNPKLIDSYKKEILGLRLTVQSIEFANKLSQNRNETDFNAIVQDLSKCPQHAALVRSMRQSRS